MLQCAPYRLGCRIDLLRRSSKESPLKGRYFFDGCAFGFEIDQRQDYVHQYPKAPAERTPGIDLYSLDHNLWPFPWRDLGSS